MKTPWQKVYSFFGFWTYVVTDENYDSRKVLYWCCLPWFRYFRKFDLISWRISYSELATWRRTPPRGPVVEEGLDAFLNR